VETNKHALVLTGGVLPGFEPAAVWKELAEYFRMEPAAFQAQVLARAPLTIKESDDLAKLEALKSGAEAVGGETALFGPDQRPALFALFDDVPRGPMPRAFVDNHVRRGVWPMNVRIAEVGGNQWRNYVDYVAPPAAAPAAPAPARVEAGATSIMPAAPPPAAGAADSSPNTRTYAMPALGTQARPAVATTDSPPPGPVADDAGSLPPGAAIHAGFWRRCAAYVFDGLVLTIAGLIVSAIFAVFAFGAAASGSLSGAIGLLALQWIIGIVGSWLYFAWQESSRAQATLGKRLMGIKVTDDAGHRIGFGRATGRFFGKIVSGIVLYIGFLLAGFTERKQALHDLMASTLVVFRDVEPGRLPSVRPPMPWYGWVLNVLPFLVFPLAMFAAIALPAYADYQARTQVAEAFALTSNVKTTVAEYYAQQRTCPSSNAEAGLADPANLTGRYVASIALEPGCKLVATLRDTAPVAVAARGGRIELTPQRNDAGEISWLCTSDLPSKLLPSSCRQ
jgi:uncharacterized RDD family membrane protein YckC